MPYRFTTLDKAGPLENQGTPVCPTVAGSHVSNGQVSAKIRALFDVIGEGAFPFPDGRILQLKPERVKIFRIHREVQ